MSGWWNVTFTHNEEEKVGSSFPEPCLRPRNRTLGPGQERTCSQDREDWKNQTAQQHRQLRQSSPAFYFAEPGKFPSSKIPQRRENSKKQRDVSEHSPHTTEASLAHCAHLPAPYSGPNRISGGCREGKPAFSGFDQLLSEACFRTLGQGISIWLGVWSWGTGEVQASQRAGDTHPLPTTHPLRPENLGRGVLELTPWLSKHRVLFKAEEEEKQSARGHSFLPNFSSYHTFSLISS